MKFLIPFALLVSAGEKIELPRSAPILAMTAIQVEDISASFSPAPPSTTPMPGRRWLPVAIVVVWFVGALLISMRWIKRWAALREIRKRSYPVEFDFPTRVLMSPSAIEPGIFGFFRPVLLLPEGLAQTLSPEQLETIMAHELSHVRSRDNLTAALHLSVASIFWFHPAVWWIGRKLIEERERACDEAVLGQGKHAETYAQSILNICKFCQETPLPCAAGVTGADLRQRIREIMSQRVAYQLTVFRKAAITAAALIAVIVPVAIGVMRSQTLPPPPQYGYEVVSIRKSEASDTISRIGPGAQGGIRAQNVTVLLLLVQAYNVRTYQFTGLPGWAQDDRFDINFTPDKPESAVTKETSNQQLDAQVGRNRQRLQAVLRDRFGLVLRAETKEMPIYALTIAKGGSKLIPNPDPQARASMKTSLKEITATAVPLSFLCNSLAGRLGRFVRDETGLDSRYDLNLKWTADLSPQPSPSDQPADEAGGSIFTALQEQLGLKLESKRGPVPVFAIEKIERPTEN